MSLVLSEDTMIDPPEAAHAASEIDDNPPEEVCPMITGLIWAAVLTIGCLLVAHVIVRWWP